VATEQLLNAIYLRLQQVDLLAELDENIPDTVEDQKRVKERLADSILRNLNE